MSGSEVFGVVAFDPPKPWPVPCADCAGTGVTGESYGMQTDRCTLLVDVFCETCGGCGNGAERHPGCPVGRDRTVHPGWVDGEDDDDQDDDDQDDDEARAACWSCQGRQWNPVQGFSGEGEDCRMVVLRVPCGCTSDRVQFLTEVPADVS